MASAICYYIPLGGPYTDPNNYQFLYLVGSISAFELLRKMLHTNVWLKFPFVCPIYPIYM